MRSERVEELHPCIVNFGDMPTRHLPFPSMVVASRNDPYMSFETARLYANLWGSELADMGTQGTSTFGAVTDVGHSAISS